MFQVELSSSERGLCRLSLSRSNSSGVATLLEILAGNCVLGQQALGSGKFICGVNRPGLCSGQLGTCASYGSLVWTRVDRKENVSGLYQRTVIKMHLRNRARNLRPDLNVLYRFETARILTLIMNYLLSRRLHVNGSSGCVHCGRCRFRFGNSNISRACQHSSDRNGECRQGKPLGNGGHGKLVIRRGQMKLRDCNIQSVVTQSDWVYY